VIKLAVFDCDGTLVNSGASIVAAASEALRAHGLAVPPPQACRQVIGLSLHQALARLAPGASAELLEQLVESYKASFARMRMAGRIAEPLFDGVVDLLDALEEDGWLLGVATGKSDRGLRHCLEQHGLHPRFLSLQTADRHPSKPDPSMVLQAMADAGAAPANTFVVGDTSFDMGMARAAGAVAIGAGWGYHSARELNTGGAHAIAATPLEVLELLPTLVGHAGA
jgi:phosphoglycolate phosphatase